MVLRINSVSTKFWTIRRRPLRKCPRIFSKYLSRRLREDSWNWPRRPPRNVCIENEHCFLVDEVLPQVTGMTRRVIEPLSWSLEKKLGQLVKVTRDGALRVPPAKFEVGQMMQWPDIKSDGVMTDGIMLRSEMSPAGHVWGATEPVLWAAKSEVFTPVVFAGGSLLWQPPWPW